MIDVEACTQQLVQKELGKCPGVFFHSFVCSTNRMNVCLSVSGRGRKVQNMELVYVLRRTIIWENLNVCAQKQRNQNIFIGWKILFHTLENLTMFAGLYICLSNHTYTHTNTHQSIIFIFCTITVYHLFNCFSFTDKISSVILPGLLFVMDLRLALNSRQCYLNLQLLFINLKIVLKL